MSRFEFSHAPLEYRRYPTVTSLVCACGKVEHDHTTREKQACRAVDSE